MRKLVTLRKIDDLQPIPDADAIVVASIDGWKVVVKKGEFQIGDPCVYMEIDSFLPESDKRYEFLMKTSMYTFEGVRGHRLRTVRLRKQVSQGLALPVSLFPEVDFDGDVDTQLGIIKWEPSFPAELAGLVRGVFPTHLCPRSDQERVQNFKHEVFEENKNARYEVSMKLDGTSCTIFSYNGEARVCSRNLELKIEGNESNTLVQMMFKTGLDKNIPGNYAFQGELMGPGIQGNRENFKSPEYFVFNIYDIDNARWLNPVERQAMIQTCGVKSVPILHENISLEELNLLNTQDVLNYAEGPSITHKIREGLVFKRIDGGFSFKAISNDFLVREK